MTDPSMFPQIPATPDLEPVQDQAGGRRADPGSRTSRLVALLAVVVLYGTLSVMQNMAPYQHSGPGEVGRKPEGGEVAKFMLLAEHALGVRASGNSQIGAMAAQQFDQPGAHPADRLQAVLVLGESESDAAALQRLESIRASVPPDGSQSGPTQSDWSMVKVGKGWKSDEEVVKDAGVMETLYSDGVGALTGPEKSRLKERYGWLGELALTHDQPEESPARQTLFKDSGWAIALIFLVGAVGLVAVVGGLTMGCIAVVMFYSGRLKRRFEPPAPGGSVYLETFAIFLLAFGVLHVSAGLVAARAPGAPWLEPAVLIAQWCMLATIFWPLLRGVTFGGWRDAVGWRAPRGVLREVFAGVAGYFACLPLFFVGILVTIVLNILASRVFGDAARPPSNPIVDLFKQSGPFGLILFLTLATMWAPIVEETIFRGSVFRHMRGRTGAFVAAVCTAFLFAYMHSYGPLMTAPLIALGFGFAMIREWRGSLIGSMTAHCLHNSTLMVIMLIGLKVMG
ncbi:MAG: CPBP family intramembrane metalloprotease [Phycisphaerales bacterium]|nr:CPBP family intramembrane metalloprotease [Phycisphaerales bacterium]